MNSITFKKVVNVNLCILGIECCWAIIMPNASAIFLFLGASPIEISFIWLLPPLMGLLISPVIGHLSDLTVTQYGRRRPYIFGGLIATCLLCFLVPFAHSLWAGIIMISILIAVINIAHNPMRALAADTIPHHQLTLGFSVQTAFVGIGSLLGAALPFLLQDNHFEIPGAYQPDLLTLGFFISGLVAVVTGLWTIFTVKEGYLDTIPESEHSLLANMKQLLSHILEMPKLLKQISIVQFFVWVGFFVLFSYFSLSIAQTHFGLPPGADIHQNAEFEAIMEKATAYNSFCFIFFQLSNLLVALTVPLITKWMRRKTLLTLVTLCGAGGMFSRLFLPTPNYILACIGLGLAFGGGMAIHLAMISSNLPRKKIGLYTGIFPMAVCLSQIITGLIVGPIIKYGMDNRVTEVVAISGIFFIIAAFFNQAIDDKIEI